MWLLLLSLVSAAWSAKLQQGYVAPPGAATAGGYPGDLAAPPPSGPTGPAGPAPEVIPIISYDSIPNNGDGAYSFSYETGNGIKASEEGVLKAVDAEHAGEAVHGVYTYTGPDGVLYTVAYTADENGFVAHGDHLPTPPPIPPEIQAALEQNAAEEAAAPQISPAGPAAPSGTAAPEQIGYFKQLPTPYFNQNYNYNHNQHNNRYYQRRY